MHDKLPADLQARATAIANGERTTANGIPIEAIPAYNTTPDRLQYHPQGPRQRLHPRRSAASGSISPATPRTPPRCGRSTGIDVAFLPMNLPYTMSVEQAADAVAAFAPGVVYPYHYKGSDTAAFARLVAESGAPDQGGARQLVRRRTDARPIPSVLVSVRFPDASCASVPRAGSFPVPPRRGHARRRP